MTFCVVPKIIGKLKPQNFNNSFLMMYFLFMSDRVVQEKVKIL